MTGREFSARARTTQWAVGLWTALYLLLLPGAAVAADPLVGAYGKYVREQFGEAAGGAVAGVTIAPLPMLVWMSIAIVIDRVVGMQCSHCKASLTARSPRVLATGECPVCRGKLFDPSAE